MNDFNQLSKISNIEQNNEILKYIELNIDNTHTSIAKLVYKLYHKQYCVITDNNKDKWFKFNGTYWQSSNSIKHELKNMLSSEIVQILANTKNKLREKIITADIKQNTYWEKERLKILYYIEKNLYNTHFKDGVIKECESIFYQEKLPDVN